jgi:acetylornithine/succinyldiaminopimelate/putrescine aminotransferase
MNQREMFFRHLAQTSPDPLALEIRRAEGNYLFDAGGKQYLDLVGGISVANVGHRHPRVLEAIRRQLDDYLHVMVYGEFVETPQVKFAKMLADHLPAGLDSVYFTNSGAEAIEGAIKLARRVNGRPRILAFNRSYHGSTLGALGLMGDEYWRNAFRPLMPGIIHLDYNSDEALEAINEDVCCLVMETVQAEAGVISPRPDWIRAIREKCTETGALLVLDEVQAGFGRTGRLWGFENFGLLPDILVLGKALGGGLPLGAFVAAREQMISLSENPVLGHITTFGGHPLSCAAGMAALEALVDGELIPGVAEKEKLFRDLLQHASFAAVRSCGLWLSVDFESEEKCRNVITKCIENGLFTDWFLFSPASMRLSPPLTITEKEIRHAAALILRAAG